MNADKTSQKPHMLRFRPSTRPDKIDMLRNQVFPFRIRVHPCSSVVRIEVFRLNGNTVLAVGPVALMDAPIAASVPR